MSTFEIYASGFQGQYSSLNAVSNQSISRTDFIRAMITVGAQSSTHFLGGRWWRGIPFRLFNGIACFSLLDFAGSDLSLEPLFRDLDMSEKTATSYWMGMGFAKLTAERILNIPWLGHVDSLYRQGCLYLSSASNSRGDLVGLDSTLNWHVIEAKGRSQRVQPNVLQDAKYQAARVTSINGSSPATTSACIVRLFTDPISVLLDDPKRFNEGEHWKINNEFFNAYYSPIIHNLKENNYETIELEGLALDFFEIELLGEQYLLGLPGTIIKDPAYAHKFHVEMIQGNNLKEKLTQYFHKDKEQSGVSHEDNNEISIGMDGIVAIHKGKHKH